MSDTLSSIEALDLLMDVYYNPETPPTRRAEIEKKRRTLEEKCKASFKYFCLLILGSRYGSFYKVHQELMDFIQQPGYQLILIPRGLYKSTICSVAFPLWVLLNYPDTAILLCNEVKKNPKKWLSEQKEFLTASRLYRWLFPNDVPADPRKFGTDVDWTSPRKKAPWKEASVEVASIEHAVVSRHFHLIIADDLVGEGNSRTPGGIARAKEWWSRSQYLFINKPSPMYKSHPVCAKVIGTRWHYSDIYSDLEKAGGPPAFVRRAVENIEGRRILLCPEVLSQEILAERRKASSSHDYQAQMMMHPVPANEALFKSWNTRYFVEADLVGKTLVSRVSVDMAIAQENHSDFTVVMVTSTDELGNLYVREYRRERMSPHEALDTIHAFKEKYDAPYMIAEGGVIDKVFNHIVHEDSKRTGRMIGMVPVKGTVMASGKRGRAYTLQPLHEQKRVFIKQDMEDLEEELMKFGFFDHDDCVDALTLVTASGHHIWGDRETPHTAPKVHTAAWWVERHERRQSDVNSIAFGKPGQVFETDEGDDQDNTEF